MRSTPKRQPLLQATNQSCGLALCAAALLGSEAEGSTTILYTNTTDITLTGKAPATKVGTTGIGSVSFDPNHDMGIAPNYAINEGSFNVAYDYFFYYGEVFGNSGDGQVSNTVSLAFLAEGEEIGDGLSYAANLFFVLDPVPLNEDVYAGLAYFDGVDYFYGWARFNLTTGIGATAITLKDFAMEQTANTSILAGAVPEPGSIILTLGGLGLATLRRRVVR